MLVSIVGPGLDLDLAGMLGMLEKSDMEFCEKMSRLCICCREYLLLEMAVENALISRIWERV